jgi:hypothetical protein
VSLEDKYRKTKEYHLVHTELVTAARYRGTVTYQEVAKLMGLPMSGHRMGSQIGDILDEISEDEARAGRPMLSAIAVNVQGTPGPGFFKLARGLGKLQGNSSAEETAFWEQEKAAVYDTWKVILPKE